MAEPDASAPSSAERPTARVLLDGLAGRISRAGLVAWSVIGILLLLYIVLKFVVSPLSVLFPPIAIALVVVYLLNPIVSALEARGVRRGIGVAAIYVIFLLVVTIVFSVLIPVVARQVSELIDAIPAYVQRAADWVNDIAARRGSDFRFDISQEDIVNAVKDNKDTAISFLSGVGSFATAAVHVIITVVIGAILSIYLLLDLPKIRAAVSNALPASRREEISGLGERVGRALGGFFRGQLFVAAFVGIASAIGLQFVARIPFGILVGIIVGIFNLVPLIGPFIGAIPAVLIGLLSGDPQRALWAVLVLLVVQQIDNHVVSPNVMGRTVRLHPVTVMLALLAGGTLAGIFGMLIVIPGVAVAKIVWLHFWERRDQIAPAVAGVSNGEPKPEAAT